MNPELSDIFAVCFQVNDGLIAAELCEWTYIAAHFRHFIR